MTLFFVWIVLGWIAGYLIIPLFRRSSEAISLDLTLGIVGALVGGSLVALLGAAPISVYGSVLAATLGAMSALIVYYAIRRFFTSRLA
jgi:uncharacterized membrane protein YeaQ/YmgE (transglycosylase-associated protein family)